MLLRILGEEHGEGGERVRPEAVTRQHQCVPHSSIFSAASNRCQVGCKLGQVGVGVGVTLWDGSRYDTYSKRSQSRPDLMTTPCALRDTISMNMFRFDQDEVKRTQT
jgi:hypothetical protein